jgi:hypothetical protein
MRLLLPSRLRIAAAIKGPNIGGFDLQTLLSE